MCTLGAVYSDRGSVLLFKNRDLLARKEIPAPIVEAGERFHYIKFGVDAKDEKPGVWAGMNECGVGILGADGNAIVDFQGNAYAGGEKTWETYEQVLALAASVDEAYKIVIDAYEELEIGGTGDIIMLADRNKAVVLEYSLHLWGGEFAPGRPYIVRTNFFAILRQFRPAPESSSLHSSSAHRYDRALQILSATSRQTTVEDVQALCCDHVNGPSAFSICRHGGEGEYRTVGSAIFEASTDGIKVHYALNDLPCQGQYRTLTLD